MPDIHCPNCQASIPFPEGSRQISCPVCQHKFDPLYPFGRPMSQSAQPPAPPPQEQQQGFTPRYPGPIGQPQGALGRQYSYPGPQYAAPGQFPPLRTRMATWKLVLLIGIPVSLYVAVMVAAAVLESDDDSGPVTCGGDYSEYYDTHEPLHIYTSETARQVYVGEEFQLSFMVTGGASPYRWDLFSPPDEWTYDRGKNTYVVSASYDEPGTRTVSVVVVDANDDMQTLNVEIDAVELAEDVARLRISTGIADKRPPWVNGDTFETYPGAKFSFDAYVECKETTIAVEEAALTWYAPTLPDGVLVNEYRRTIRFSGRLNEVGEYDIRVVGDVRFREFSKALRRERTFTLKVLPVPESDVPENPGKLTIVNPEMFKDAYSTAYIILDPPEYPYTSGRWPADVAWSFEGDAPPGMEVVPGKLQWTVKGKPTKPGEYTLKVKGKVSLKLIDQADHNFIRHRRRWVQDTNREALLFVLKSMAD